MVSWQGKVQCGELRTRTSRSLAAWNKTRATSKWVWRPHLWNPVRGCGAVTGVSAWVRVPMGYSWL